MGGEEDCGNFGVCYTDETDARKAMVEDYESTLRKWETDVPDDRNMELIKWDNFCAITLPYDSYDYHNWWIDKLELK